MVKVKDMNGKEVEVDCIGCALSSGKINGGIKIAETDNFEAYQDFETPIPGFVIISSKKHIKGIEDLNKNERSEFIEFLYKCRKAISDVLDIEFVYIINKEDSFAVVSHFHVWLLPKYEWMTKFNRKLSGITESIEYSRENMRTDDNLNEVRRVGSRLKEELV